MDLLVILFLKFAGVTCLSSFPLCIIYKNFYYCSIAFFFHKSCMVSGSLRKMSSRVHILHKS